VIDQDKLEWFLSYGITVFERSTTGAILDKIAMDAFASRRCHVCDGSGIIQKTFQTRTGKSSYRLIEAGSWCFKCNGVGRNAVRLSPEEQAMAGSSGHGHRDTDSMRAAVPDAVIVQYATVSRRLARMPRVLMLAIMDGYGDEGAECALTPKGRAWAVTPRTTPGRRLLAQERARKEATKGVNPERPVRAMLALAALDGHKPNADRTKLLAEASQMAVALLLTAERSWETISAEDHQSAELRRQVVRACMEASHG